MPRILKRNSPDARPPIRIAREVNGEIVGNFQSEDGEPYKIPIRSSLVLRKVRKQQEKNKKEGG